MSLEMTYGCNSTASMIVSGVLWKAAGLMLSALGRLLGTYTTRTKQDESGNWVNHKEGHICKIISQLKHASLTLEASLSIPFLRLKYRPLNLPVNDEPQRRIGYAPEVVST